MPTADQAAAYAERLGFAVFGVLPNCKVPYKQAGRFEHGCHDATKDPCEVRRRWTEVHPGANVALATGTPSGVFALDIDAKGSVDGYASLAILEAKHAPLPPTWRVRTPSGGEHRYFRQPDLEMRNKVGLRICHPDGSRTVFPGLDIRSTGASVALPPSRKPNGAYAWEVGPGEVELADAPAWLLALTVDPPPPPRRLGPPLRLSDMDRTSRYVAAAVDSEFNTLSRMRPGSGRNQQLFQSSANLGEFVGAGLLPQSMAEDALERAAAECGLLQEDGAHAVRMTIASGMRKGVANPREVRSS